jgi:hypothetical protein
MHPGSENFIKKEFFKRGRTRGLPLPRIGKLSFHSYFSRVSRAMIKKFFTTKARQYKAPRNTKTK